GLAQAPGRTRCSDGLAGRLPGGDGVPPDPLPAGSAALGPGHVGGLRISEKATGIPAPARRPSTGRSPLPRWIGALRRCPATPPTGQSKQLGGATDSPSGLA